MIKKNLVILTILLIGSKAFSQEFSSRIFHKGWLVTTDQDTLKGDLMYDMESNAVQIINEDKIVKTYSSKKVIFFEIFDRVVKSYRQFYSIPYVMQSNYKAPIIFEVLYEGKTTLLVREKIVTTTQPDSQSYYNQPGGGSRETLSFSYFFVDKTGNMTAYMGRKNELFEIFEKNAEQLKKYIKSNKLQINEMRDLVRITAFYNSL